MKKYMRLMRVHHYIKNVLIFLPLIFSGHLFEPMLFMKTFLGFCSFSFVSSAVYIINDIKDVENDRQHETKHKRPIASGAVSVSTGYILAGILVIFSIVFNYLSSQYNFFGWIFIALYFVLNLGYSLGMKNLPIIDIAILVSGFVFRVVYGSVVTNIEISKWLYLTVITMSFYLGLGKRRNELLNQTGNSRKVLKYYNENFLDKNMYMCLALTIAFYSLWSVDPVTLQRVSSSNLIWTVPLIILICMKYSLNIEKNSDGDPVEVVLGDKALIGLITIYAFITIKVIYF